MSLILRHPAIGFKEWQVVCDALSSGRQSLILRKGGIHEGREGFSFAHDAFFLFPTRFHVSSEQVREGEVSSAPEWEVGDLVRITHYVQVPMAVTLTDWNRLLALEPLHIYTRETLRDRFDWEGKGMASGSIHVALAEVYALAEPWEFPYEKGFGGCRSWLTLPQPPGKVLEKATEVSGANLDKVRLLLK